MNTVWNIRLILELYLCLIVVSKIMSMSRDRLMIGIIAGIRMLIANRYKSNVWIGDRMCDSGIDMV